VKARGRVLFPPFPFGLLSLSASPYAALR